ncbi:adhesion protein FadA [Leptotrichia sp. oral taxon 879]|uniref:Adhesion protein FadA n=1 Tax=Leptotrichia mesophila TaxID=3239303 RepID=A0AB39V8X2_9FUSO|nr:adhesion protein FadA [Leptotrichia sp. oral taxon 879]ERK49545.1 adhesion protein FadA [Leptotrichia sp. oral taxon 879 str. F0557]
MKKTIFFLVGIMMVSSIGFSAKKQSIESSIDSIDNQYEELLKKEEAQKESYRSQKAQLEAELEKLKVQQSDKEKVVEKLRVDSEVRWHREKYKKILKYNEPILKNLNKNIAEKEQKIAELDTLLSVMN